MYRVKVTSKTFQKAMATQESAIVQQMEEEDVGADFKRGAERTVEQINVWSYSGDTQKAKKLAAKLQAIQIRTSKMESEMAAEIRAATRNIKSKHQRRINTGMNTGILALAQGLLEDQEIELDEDSDEEEWYSAEEQL